jgi:O-antigen/teichoic acid export membrane protein
MQSNTFKNTIWLGISYGIRMGSQAFVFILLARALGVKEFGLLAAAIAAANIIAPIVEYGANTLPVSDVVSGISVARATGVSFMLSIFILPLNLILLSILKLILLHQVPWNVVILVGLVVFLGNRMSLLANTIHISQSLLWRNAVVDVTNGTSLIALVFVFMQFELSLNTWVLWWFLQSLAVGCLALLWLTQTWGRPTWSFTDLQKRLKSGFFFTVNGAATSTYADFDKTLLARLSSAESVGVFTSSHRLIALANVPLAAFIGAVYPKFFVAGNLGLDHARKFVWKLLPFTVGYSLIITTLIWFFAPLLANVLGDGYADTTATIRWLCWGIILQCIYLPFMEVLTGSGFQAKRMYGQVAALLISASVNFWLIPSLAWKGAAIAVLCSQVFLTIYMVSAVYNTEPPRKNPINKYQSS